MIKNKDGSYNKFPLLIISLIIIIGAGIVGSLIIAEPPTIDIMTVAYIGLFISGLLTIYYGKKVFFKPKPTITHMMQTSTPTSTPSKMEVVEVHPQKQFTVEDEPIKIETPYDDYKPIGSGFGLSNITAMILTFVVGAIVLMIGTVVINSMMQALPQLPSDSPMSTSLTSVTENVGTAFNFLAIGMFVIAAIGIILIVSNMLGSNHYD